VIFFQQKKISQTNNLNKYINSNLKPINMKDLAILFIVNIVILISLSCTNHSPTNNEPRFIEIILDDQAPQNLWTKSYGDVNGDGKTDILVGGWRGGGLVAYLAPDWEKISINDSISVGTDSEVCDLNNNGIQDIVTIDYGNRALIWLSGPDWEYHLIDTKELHDAKVADLNGDGLLDIVARNQAEFGNRSGDTLYFYIQRPQGGWTKYTQPVVNGEGIKVADVNNNGRQDIIINGYWLENTGNMRYWIEHKFTDTWKWRNTYIDFADINGDGKPDIIYSPAELAGQYYRISWFEQPDDPTMKWKEHIIADSVECVVHSIGSADINSNGRMDIVTADMKQGKHPQEVAVYYNLGNNRWEKEVISTEGSHSMIMYDFTGNGAIDIAGGNHQENIMKMWINQGKK
jgi:hypothetical protein